MNPNPHTLIRHPRVGIVICTWNKKDYVLALLDSLLAHPYPNSQILIVDNNSGDCTREAVLSRYPQVKYIFNPVNIGGSGGFNTGLCAMLQTEGLDYVWLLDNDVRVGPGALEVLVETLENRPDAAIAGSHIIQMDYPQITNEIGGGVNLPMGQLILHQHNTPEWMHRDEVVEVDYVAACSMLVRYSALKHVGIWDDFFIHYDDVDWCLRMKQAGYAVLACAASRIYHMSANVKRVTWILYYDLRNILYLQDKHQVMSGFHFFKFCTILLAFACRDLLSGKDYYCRLAEMALRDFFAGRMGRKEQLPALQMSKVREVLNRVLEEGADLVYVLDPVSQVVFSDKDLKAARIQGTRVVAVCAEAATRLKGVPQAAERLPLASNKLLMLFQLIRLLFKPRADYLILDIDHACGLLGLCARNIVLLVDQQAQVVPGGWSRLGAVAGLLLRAPLLYLRLVGFLFRRRARRGCAAQTPEQFEQELTAMGGSIQY
ncbi:MAG: glycosyltransferase family 2 protein [Kiritimatiellae bacterium]|nr:glycosyltransferase family 2 protein [Kiritimatiellia bacterium]MDD4736267.1 glycosyltransferase family 2 protein [Kiritimatiellia bacterium]